MRRQARITALLLLSLPLFALRPAPTRALHLSLEKSEPEADAVVASPAEIRLWFSERPQDAATSIRLQDSAGVLLGTGEVTASADDATVFGAAVPRTLPDGVYTVAWRTMATDGHTVRGEFSFTVRGGA